METLVSRLNYLVGLFSGQNCSLPVLEKNASYKLKILNVCCARIKRLRRQRTENSCVQFTFLKIKF